MLFKINLDQANHRKDTIVHQSTRMSSIYHWLQSLGMMCTWLSFLFIPSLLHTQSAQKNFVYNDWLIEIKGWGVEEGFPETRGLSFTDLFQDSRDLLWFYPNNRLVCFDGTHFKVFDKSKTGGAKIVYIKEDSDGKLWLTTNNGGQYKLGIFDLETEQYISLEAYIGQGNEAVRQISQIHSNFYFNKTEKGLFIINPQAGKIWRYDQKNFQLYLDDKRKPDKVLNYYPGPDGLSWQIIYADSLTRLITNKGVVLKEFITPDFSQKNYLFDDEHNIWNINYYDTKEKNLQTAVPITYQLLDTTNIIPPLDINEVHLWGRFQSFVSNKKSGIQIFPLNPIVPLYKNEIIIPHFEALLASAGIQVTEYLQGILSSNDEGFWIPNGDILWHVNITKNHFSTLVNGKSIRSIIELKPDSTLLVMGYGFAPFVLSSSTPDRPLPPIADIGRNAYYDQDYLWYGNDDGMNRWHFPSQENTLFPIKSGPPIFGPEVRTLHFLSDSTLLFCSDRGVFCYYFKEQKLEEIVSDVKGYWVHKDQSGAVWVGTDAGLYHLASSKNYLQTIGNQNLAIKHIHETPGGYFWLSTDQGLIHWKPFSNHFERITSEYGLLTDNIHACYPDKRGVLWLSTNYGISAYNPEQKYVQNFLKQDGLAGNEQNYLAHHQGKDGRLYFGGIDGITSFYPDRIPLWKENSKDNLIMGALKMSSPEGDLIKTQFRDEDKAVIIVPPDCSQLSTEVMLPTSNKHPLVLQWRIPGIFPKWSTIQGNQISINGLTAGPHTLEIQAYTIDSPLNTSHWSFPISKQVYFYQTAWFFIICIGITGLSVWGIAYYRAKLLRQQKKVLKKIVDQRTHQLEVQNAIIEEQNHTLKEVDRTKNQFFKNISHELRTPLSLISLYSEELLKKTPQQQPVKLIKEQTMALSNMIDEMLSLQKIDSGILPLQKSPKDWITLLRYQFGLFVGLAQKKQLLYLLELPSESELILNFDQKKVTRIVQNLIGNAIKYTPEKGQVTVRCVLEEQTILFLVKDNGPGIPSKERKTIFKRYYQGEAAKNQSQPGYGIGLALSMEYTKLMNAELWVESELGKGSSFFFRFPKEEVATTALEIDNLTSPTPCKDAALSTLTPIVRFEQKKAHLLIVEDNDELLDFLKEQFSQAYTVTAVPNGQLALSYLKENADIDLIISDLMMPIMGGQELLKLVRQEEAFGFIPFIILTAIDNQITKIEAFQLGLDAYVTKPFDIQELRTRVDNLVHFQQARRAFRKSRANKVSPNPKLKETIEKGYDQEWINKLVKVVEKELHRPDLKILDLAYQMHVSERTLRNKISLYTGMKPNEYITQARISYAIDLFNQRKYSTVAEVAYACGFKNTRYFSQVFKQAVGKTPSGYLEKINF